MKTVTWITSLLCSIMTLSAYGQTISGHVLDASNNEPLAFASVVVKGTTNGVTTDIDGSFAIEVETSESVTLEVDYLGYTPKEVKETPSTSSLTILLEESTVQLTEVVVRPDDSYDKKLFKKIIKRKKQNNPSRFENISYNEYTRISAFWANLKKSFRDNRIFKGAADAFVAQSDSSVMMPLYISEQIARYSNINGKESHKVIHKTSEALMDNLKDEITSVLNQQLTTNINFYDNNIVVMTRGFTSPLSSSALSEYNMYVVDSTHVDGVKRYRFDFYPKNYRNITFKGHFWVEDESFALISIEAALPKSANINFVNAFQAEVTYRKYPNGQWLTDRQRNRVNLTWSKPDDEDDKGRNFEVQRVISYQDVIVDKEQLKQKVLSARQSTTEAQVEKEVAAILKATPMDEFEKQARDGIVSLQQTSVIKHIDKLSAAAFTGYYNLGKIDVGPFFDFYQSNAIEGSRITLPVRTNQHLWPNLSLGGYVSYGLKNKKWKYGGSVKYQLPLERRTIASLGYKDDYLSLSKNTFGEFVRENPFSKGSGNIITTFTSKPNYFVARNKQFTFSIESELTDDVNILVRPFYRQVYSNTNVPFRHGEQLHSSFTNTGVLTNLRLSFAQEYDDGYFSRFYYGSQKPIINLSVEVGQNKIPGVKLKKNGLYTRLNLSLKNRFTFGQGFVRLLLDGGYIIGDVPFPLLHMPRGTEGYGFARYHFNLLHQVSTASDAYANAHISINGGGTIFNRIPLINKLNLREVLSLKTHYGKLIGNHNSIFELPTKLRSSPKLPYVEMGIGVGNIFKFLRIEYVRRLTNHKSIRHLSAKHGIRARLEMAF